MRVVIAPDSFKECLSAMAVARALEVGWRRVYPEAEIRLAPMADGGEGTVDALVAATGGQYVTVRVTGPMGTPVDAVYGRLDDGHGAVIEMAAASGLPLVPVDQRNPEQATTYGTGELIRHAIVSGARRIIVGIGGSATNDGGAGMAQALGYALLDAQGRELPLGGAALARLAHIDAAGRFVPLDEVEILAACDVDNPLCGPRGASQVYGPQKGADPAMVLRLDAALQRLGEVAEAELGIPVLEVPGAGAAGGLGAGLLAFAGARLRSGVELVAEACGLAACMEGADLVITGEGRMDAQSVHGKTPVGVARIAKEQGLPVAAVTGALGPGYEAVYRAGIDAVWPLCAAPMSLEDAIARAETRLQESGEAIARTWRAFRG